MDVPIGLNLAAASAKLRDVCQSLGVATDRIPSEQNVDLQIAALTQLAIDPLYTEAVAACFSPIVAEFAARWISTPLDPSTVLDALARIVHISTTISHLADRFLSSRPHLLSFHDTPDVVSTLLASYRLLVHNRALFKSHVDLKALNHLVSSESYHSSVKYLALRILAVYFEVSEAARDEWMAARVDTSKPVLGPYEGTTVDYVFLPLLEAKRLSRTLSLIGCDDSTPLHITPNPLVKNLGGVLVASFLGSLDLPAPTERQYESRFVHTTGALLGLQMVASSLVSSNPVLLTGPEGSGKTFLVDEVAKYMDKYKSLVRIHLGDQTDAKILLGTYSTGRKPGSFEWRAGILTQAVREGRWVLIEDIDKAPTEILSLLLPLLEKGELLIPSRNEIVSAQRGFQVFGTITSSSRGGTESLPDLIGKRLWSHISLPSIASDELVFIVKQRFPLLAGLAPKFVQVYGRLREESRQPRFLSLTRSSNSRHISPRDLIKWAKRVEMMLKRRGIVNSSSLPAELYDDIFAEAIDCFAAFIPAIEARRHLASVIAESLEISETRMNLYLTRHVPPFSDTSNSIVIGRAAIPKYAELSRTKSRLNQAQRAKFALTNHSLRLIEQIGVGASLAEPILLVGETGTGKTTVVQYLASVLNKKLTIINVSQQTESGDLLGGYKPVDSKMIALPIRELFDELFEQTFSAKKNEKFLNVLNKSFIKSHWTNCVKLWREAFKMASELLAPQAESPGLEGPKKKRKLDSKARAALLTRWDSFLKSVNDFDIQAKEIDKSFFFSFVEGLLVQAVRRGDWVLLDEINLASPDTLESISELLVEMPSITLSEKGDAGSVPAHPEFRLFGCMNPATDIGKRDLPSGLRSRFTELYVASPDGDISDLLAIIDKYVGHLAMSDQWIGNDVAELYLAAKQLSEENKIVDGANQKPHFSIRTLSRTLVYASSISPIYGLRRSLYEGFCMSFLTLLDKPSEDVLHPLIVQHTLARLKNPKSVMAQIPPAPADGHSYIQFRHYWLRQGPIEPEEISNYIITPFVEKNLLSLTRATAGRLFPVLIQGPTSSGKTSMINYLARKSGHKFVRINNHEHTDLQEYLGSYVSDQRGQLKFQEGVLVEAVRNGYWIVLDELNLAPTDVLEALNRLLDDNRELLIPETQEVVKPHPDFMLFATQNPPGLYGGRKMLSRAFRNRFLELHFDDIPEDELESILRDRCQIAPSYAKKIVDVYRQLGIERQSTRLFEQKNSFATLRDLFRWANREAVGYEQLALNGYILLGERVRRREEREVVKRVIEKIMKVNLDAELSYTSLLPQQVVDNTQSVVWTNGMKRLLVLVSEALKNCEPVLLVGETGCGKTTICQIIADSLKTPMHIVNAHQNTETGDIIGAQRPVRERSEIQRELYSLLGDALSQCGISTEEAELSDLLDLFHTHSKDIQAAPGVTTESYERILELIDRQQVLFEWRDGTLVQALKNGDFFLLDEISLADDSVLERLNSVLEPERTMLLPEKGSQDILVTAKEGFQFMATMNPGGDYGKKELSPALRNRFTEIWVPSMEDVDDVRLIASSRLNTDLTSYADSIVEFGSWFGSRYGGGDVTSGVVSLRDILAWIDFMNRMTPSVGPELSFFHGACMVFVDSVGTNNTASLTQSASVLLQHRVQCVQKLSELLAGILDCASVYLDKSVVSLDDRNLNIGPFRLERSIEGRPEVGFNLSAPTTAMNAMRIVRAMQVRKPILLEGSPGVGKTSIVTALAELSGRPLTRINLSEQTDLIDLFGSDTPAEGKKAGEFVWKDAPFLRAMQRGEWVLLDEMNLASQSVLEGLNACLDHRGEAYIPELDKVFHRGEGFTVFAAQNPQYQGGGRKGLPKSFINRFSVVYVDTLSLSDLDEISAYLFPQIAKETTSQLIRFVIELDKRVSIKKEFGQSGSPFEFNLRDTMRWLGLIQKSPNFRGTETVYQFYDLVIGHRFRTDADRRAALGLFESFFGRRTSRDVYFQMTPTFLQCGNSILERSQGLEADYSGSIPLQCNISVMETLIGCIQHAWPVILVGPSSSGKTSLIRFLANTQGQKLTEFSMNGDIDSTDLLGGFDQVDVAHRAQDIRIDVQRLVTEASASILKSTTSNASDWENLFSGLVDVLKRCEEPYSDDWLANLSAALQRVPLFSTSIDAQVDVILKSINLLSVEASKVQMARFQWLDGALLRAVERGHWLVLDNANLCNPSVLDRLNSLLEPNGCLIVNECSLENGEPRLVKPHKDFRLFLTVDPKYGELSRAMRNRGVEVFLDVLESRATPFDRDMISLAKTNDVDAVEESLLALSLNDGQTKKISSFVDPSDSYLRYFSMVEDALSADLEHTEVEAAVNAAIRVIPFSAIQLVDRWLAILRDSGYFDSSFVQFATTLGGTLASLGKTRFYSSVQDFYRSVLASAFEGQRFDAVAYQPLNPLTNMALCRLGATTLSPVQYHLTISLLSMGYRTGLLLQTAAARAQALRPSELSYLEKSAAIHLGRTLKSGPVASVFALTEAVVGFISDVLVMFEQCGVDQLNALLELAYICDDLNKLTSDMRCDESRLHVYREELETWIGKHESTVEFSVLGLSNLQSQVSSFGSELKLSTGQSMSLIWKNYKEALPVTEIGWRQYTEILELAERFDKVAQLMRSDSLPSINSMREALLMLLDEVCKNADISETKMLLVQVEAGIASLESSVSEFNEGRVEKYLSSYDTLFLLEEMAHSSGSSSSWDRLMRLAYHANESTKHLQMYKRAELDSPFLPILDSLAKNDVGKVRSTLQNSLLDLLVQNENSLKTSQLGEFVFAVDDFKDLMEMTVLQSAHIVAEKLPLLRSILVSQLTKCRELHYSTPDSEDSKQAFEKVNSEFFEPALALMEKGISERSLGEAWVRYALGMILLYVPDIPFDPAIRQHVMIDRNTARLDSQNLELAAWKVIQTIFVGASDDPVEQVLQEQRSSISAKETAEVSAFRPEKSRLKSLHNEWSSAMDSAIGVQSVMMLITETTDPEVITVWQSNCSRYIDRLQSHYAEYGDIVGILVGFIRGLQLGVSLTSMRSEDNELQYRFLLNPLVISSEAVFEKFENQRAIWKRSMSPAEYNELLLQSLESSVVSVKRNYLPERAVDTVQQIYKTFYYEWSLRHMREAAQKAEEASIYKDNSAEEYDEDFKKTFPDYEDVMDIRDHENLQSEESQLQEVYLALSDLHVKLFDKSDPESVSKVLGRGTRRISTLRQGESSQVDDPSILLGSIFVSASTELKQISESSKDTLNFYHDGNYAEALRAVDFARRTKLRVGEILKRWPEHATLQNISTACQELLEYRISTPLARLLQKIEQIFLFLNEWESYASREVSVAELITQVVELIISWRRLELSTWPAMMTFEEVALQKTSAKWWFYLYENIIDIPMRSTEDSEEMPLSQLAQVLIVFVSEATYGQFERHLSLLSSFASYATLLAKQNPVMSNISDTIRNVVSYYSLYSDHISEQVGNSRSKLKKDMQDVILLASWKDTNVSALKESARRSHHALYKIIRKYRQFLGQKITSIVDGGSKSLSTSDAETIAVYFTSSGADVSQVRDHLALAKNLQIWSSRPLRLKNIGSTVSSVADIVDLISEELFPSLLPVAASAVEEANRLRDLTPKVLTEDTKKVVSALKMEKSKSLSEIMKQLRSSGLKYHVKANIASRQMVTSSILQSMAPLDFVPINKDDAYFLKSLELLPRIRASVASNSTDIATTVLQRAIAIADNFVASVLTLRKTVADLWEQKARVEAAINASAKVASMLHTKETLCQKSGSFSQEWDSIHRVIKWAPDMAHIALSVSQGVRTLGRVSEIETLSKTLGRFLQYVSDVKRRTNDYPLSIVQVGTQSWINLCEDLQRELINLAQRLKDIAIQHPEDRFACSLMLQWIDGVGSLATGANSAQSRDDIISLNSLTCEISDSILVVLQGVRSSISSVADEETNDWFSSNQIELVKCSKALHADQVTAKIEQCLRLAASVGSSDGQSGQDSIALVGAIVPFLQEYSRLHSRMCSLTLDKYNKDTKSVYMLLSCLSNLAQSGFCSPQEESKEEEAGATKEGTGLGDGSGAKDHSDDIEEDEDLSEHAQKDNDEADKDNKDEDKEDKAQEIEGDMAGDLEDASDQEKDEDDEDDDDEAENELDEEVGDIDDLDPNAIDQKMWDEKPTDDKREKESDDVPNGNSDEMEGQEDQNEKDTGDRENDNQEGQEEEPENDSSAEDEEDVGEQEDNVRQDAEDLEENVPQTDTLELPDDMKLEESGDEGEDDNDEDRGDLEDVDDEADEGEMDDGTQLQDEPSEETKEGEDDPEEGHDPEGDQEEDAMEQDEGAGNEVDENPAQAEEEEGGKEEQTELDSSKGESSEKQMDVDTEGLHGPDSFEDDNENAEQSTTTEQQTESKGEGEDVAQQTEQENAQNGGGMSSLQPPEEKERTEDESIEDPARKDAEESMQKLGDSMKEFYRRRQEIQSSSVENEEVPDKANTRPDEFQHLDGDSSAQDTQALGEASAEQSTGIDDRMAIDDDEAEAADPEERKLEESEAVTEDQEAMEDGGELQQQNQDASSKLTSMVGRREADENEFGVPSEDVAKDFDDEDTLMEETFTGISNDANEQPFRSMEESRELWKRYDTSTQDLALGLCEQLRLILEPTLATKLRGDFKTGKRLNMKRIIPYIASQFKKDKIWMRRTKPSKRQFQIMISVDDSKSMSESKSVDLAFQTIALVSKALTLLESGQLAITQFGDNTRVLHEFEKPFSGESGAEVLQWFGFDAQRTDVRKLLSSSIDLFERAKHLSRQDLWQLEIIISDGVCEDHEHLRRLVRKAQEERIMLVFVIVDAVHKGESILDMNQVAYDTSPDGAMKLKVTRYLDTFPFDFYVIVRDIRELPGVLSSVLRQYFAQVAEH